MRSSAWKRASSNPIVGDLLVENVYGGYQIFGTLKVPTRITQRRAGFPVFEATITPRRRIHPTSPLS